MRTSFFFSRCLRGSLLPTLLLTLSGVLSTASVQAAAYHFTLIADDFTPRPDGQGDFGFNGGNDSSPTLNDGVLVFRVGDGDSIWQASVDSSGLKKIADLTRAVPKGVGDFTAFDGTLGQPLIKDGIIVFEGTSASPDGNPNHFNYGFYSIPVGGGTISRIVDLNTPVPDDPDTENFTGIGTGKATNDFDITSGKVVFEGGGAHNSGVFIANSDGSGLKALADFQHPVADPDSTVFMVENFGTPAVFGSTVAFVGGTVEDPSNGYDALFTTPTGGGFNYKTLLSSDTVLPGDQDASSHTRFDVPPLAFDGKTIVFEADDVNASPDTVSLYAEPVGGGAATKLVDAKTTTLAGLDAGVTHYIDGFSLDNGQLVFAADDDDSHYGVYLMNADGSGSIQKVIGTGDTVVDGKGNTDSVLGLELITGCLSGGYIGLKVEYGSEYIGLFVAVPGGAAHAPVVTSGSESATTGEAFSYQITATNSPASYAATGLPSGLTVNTKTGVISGTPAATAAGKKTITLKAYNSAGGGTGTLTLTIAKGKPVITSATTATAEQGKAFSYQITATNSPTSYTATGLPKGLSVNKSTGLISGTPASTALGTKTLDLSATNSAGTGTATLTLTISK